MRQNCSTLKHIFLLFFVLYLSVAVPAQQEGTSESDSSNSGAALEKLTIQFTNGTPDADLTEPVTGVVFDFDQYKSSQPGGENSSLLEQLKKHGTNFKASEPSVDIELREPINNPVLVAVYKGGIYQKRLKTTSASKTVKMTVYEPTRNKDSIRIQRHHIPLERRKNKLVVSEVLIFKNTGNRTFIGPEGYRKSIPITLPAEAHHVQIGGARRQPEAGPDAETSRYWLSKTLTPDRPISARIRYHLPLEGNVTLERNVDYLTNTFFFAAGKGGLEVMDHSDNLSKKTRPSPDGKREVVQLSAQNLSAGQTVSVTMRSTGPNEGGGTGASSPGSETGNGSGTSKGGSKDQSMDLGFVVIGVLAGLSLLVSFMAILVMYRSNTSGASSGGDSGMTREILMEEIARLDQDLEEGKISESYHEERRERLKSRLMELEKGQLS